jgi:hypothetical protein
VKISSRIETRLANEREIPIFFSSKGVNIGKTLYIYFRWRRPNKISDAYKLL